MTTGTRLLRTECCLPNCCAISLHMKNSWLPHFQFFFSSTNNSTSFSRPLTIVSVAYLIANWVSHEIYLTFLLMKEKKCFAMMLLTSHIRAACFYSDMIFTHVFSLHFSMHNHDPKIKMTSFTSKNFITSHNIQFYSCHKIQQIFPVPIGNPLINSYWRCCMHIDKLRSITIG